MLDYCVLFVYLVGRVLMLFQVYGIVFIVVSQFISCALLIDRCVVVRCALFVVRCSWFVVRCSLIASCLLLLVV